MKATFKLIGPEQRQRAIQAILNAPNGFVCTVAEATRTLDQNAKLWPMLTDIERAKPEGRDHLAEDWKTLFMHDVGRELRLLPALNGGGFVPLGYSTRVLTKGEFGDLIECIYAYGARHDVRWSEKVEQAA